MGKFPSAERVAGATRADGLKTHFLPRLRSLEPGRPPPRRKTPLSVAGEAPAPSGAPSARPPRGGTHLFIEAQRLEQGVDVFELGVTKTFQPLGVGGLPRQPHSADLQGKRDTRVTTRAPRRAGMELPDPHTPSPSGTQLIRSVMGFDSPAKHTTDTKSATDARLEDLVSSGGSQLRISAAAAGTGAEGREGSAAPRPQTL